MASARNQKDQAAEGETPRHTALSVVIFDVVATEAPTFDLEEIMLQLFAYTPAVRLREDTRAQYQSGDYDRRGKKTWTGRLRLQRDSITSHTRRDSSKGYVFEDSKGERVLTSESDTFYAFNPELRTLAFRERANLPYTRMISYVRAALLHNESKLRGVASVHLRPRLANRPIREWLEHFTEVKAVTLRYSHSQSPGNRAVDILMDALNASSISEVVRAPAGDTLNSVALLDTKSQIGRAIEHIDLNADNGHAIVEGKVDDELLKIDTKTPVERVRRMAVSTPLGIGAALTEVALLPSSPASPPKLPPRKGPPGLPPARPRK
jgi:hypothetical protein